MIAAEADRVIHISLINLVMLGRSIIM